jgi:hypothetical protein
MELRLSELRSIELRSIEVNIRSWRLGRLHAGLGEVGRQAARVPAAEVSRRAAGGVLAHAPALGPQLNPPATPAPRPANVERARQLISSVVGPNQVWVLTA